MNISGTKKPMKVLITGGTGFTGSHLAKRIASTGTSIRLLVRDKLKVELSDSYAPEIIEGDVRDSASVEAAVRGVDTIFHIAAAFRTAGISDKVYWDVNVKGTMNLLNSALKYNVHRFVHCSTIGVHGNIENPPANETYRFNPGDIYQRTKLEAELAVHRFFRETGLPCIIIRPCAIYGPGDVRLLKLFKLGSWRVVPILGSGKVFFHMVYIDDLVDAFLLAAETKSAIGQAFIIGGAERLTLLEIIEIISRISGKSTTKLFLPPKPFQMLGDICERIFIPFGMEPPIFRRRVDFFTKSRSFDIGKASRILGYSPKVGIEEGLMLTAEWYRSKGYLKQPKMQ